MLKTQILENLQNAGKCRKKNSKLKTTIQHILTQRFLVKVTLEKPPTTLGENQFESSFLFLKNAFYSERNIQKNQQVNFYNLSRFPCLTTASENVQTANTEPAINAVQISLKNVPINYNINFCCTTSSYCVQNNNKCCCTTSLECVQLY